MLIRQFFFLFSRNTGIGTYLTQLSHSLILRQRNIYTQLKRNRQNVYHKNKKTTLRMSTIPTLKNKSSRVNKTLRFQTKCLTESVSTCLKSIRIFTPVEAGNLCSAAYLLTGEELHFWHGVFQYFMELHILFPCRLLLNVPAERV